MGLLTALCSLLTTLSLILVFHNSLITLGCLALIFCITFAALLSLTFSSWIGIVILLIYMGGLIVLFAYFLAICPNQKNALTPLGKAFFPLTILLIQPTALSIHALTPPIPLTTLFSPTNLPLLLFLTAILLFTLITVVKIVETHHGPLRPFAVKPNPPTK